LKILIPNHPQTTQHLPFFFTTLFSLSLPLC